jgi:hypothetical protein
VLRHVILFHLHEGADPDVAIRLLEEARPAGVLKWVIKRSLDERKGTVIVEDTTFVDQEALDAYRVSDAHKPVADYLGQRADWVVGDWWE